MNFSLKNNRLLGNVISLSSIQIASYIFPLITIPYLVRTLDAYGFGVLALALAVVKYFNMAVEYGFNLTATRSISLDRSNKQSVSETFWSVLLCKAILLLLGLFILVIVVENVGDYRQYRLTFYSMYLMVVGGAITPFWLFQGMESMKGIAISNILAKLIYVPSVFIFVHNADDIWIAALLQSSVFVFSGLISLILVVKNKWIEVVPISINDVYNQYKQGFYLFLSTISVSFYSNTFIVLLGTFHSPTIVGYYSAADKIRQAVQGMLVPISQAIFPKIALDVKLNHLEAKNKIKNLFFLQGGVSVALGLTLYTCAEIFVTKLYGDGFESSIVVLKILSLIPLVVGVSNFLGQQIMINFDLKREFTIIICLAGIIGCTACYLTAKYLNLYYVAGLSVAVESFVLLLMFIVTYKRIYRGIYAK